MDRCFFIRYKKNGHLMEEAAGWSSAKMSAAKANEIRAEITQNIREGRSPQSMKEKREIEERRQAEEVRQAELEKRQQFTFDEAAQAFLEWGRDNKKSWRDDQGRYENYIKPVIGHIPMRQVSPFHLEKIRSNMKKWVLYPNRKKQKTGAEKQIGLSEKTIHLTFTLVRSIYRKQMSWGLYDGPVPTERINFPGLDNARTRFLSADEASLLLKQLKKQSLPLYCQTLLGLYCGLRFSEIASLRWADVDMTHGVLYIRDAKGGKSREAYIPDALKNIFYLLDGGKDRKKKDLVFPDRSKERKKQKHVSSTFYRAVEKLGFNDGVKDRRQRVCFHTLRHTFGSWLAIQGTSLYEIKELMGHSSITMTERYSHLLPSIKRDAVNRMAETFDGVLNKEDTGEKEASDKKPVVVAGS